MNNAPEEDSEAITSLLQRASEKIRGELTAEIGMILARERDQKVILSQIGEVYDRLVAPLIHDLLLLEMRFTCRVDHMEKLLEETDNEGGSGKS